MAQAAARRQGTISIHALREERDGNSRFRFCARFNFNPRAPRGARRLLPRQ